MPADLSNEEAMDDEPCDGCGIGPAMETLMCPACVDTVRATLLASLIEKVEGIPYHSTGVGMRRAVRALLRTEAENGC